MPFVTFLVECVVGALMFERAAQRTVSGFYFGWCTHEGYQLRRRHCSFCRDKQSVSAAEVRLIILVKPKVWSSPCPSAVVSGMERGPQRLQSLNALAEIAYCANTSACHSIVIAKTKPTRRGPPPTSTGVLLAGRILTFPFSLGAAVCNALLIPKSWSLSQVIYFARMNV